MTDNTQLQQLKEQRLKEILNPDLSALIVVDMQNDFVAPNGKSAVLNEDISTMQAIIPRIVAVTNLFYAKKRPVIRTITYEDPELRNIASLDRYLWFEKNDRENQVVCLKGSWGAELFMPAQDGDIIVEKERISAYVDGKLREVLLLQDVKTVVIVGVKTQRCVARLVQDLYDNEPDLHVVVLEDCVASDNNALHESMITEMKMFYPPVITSDELIAAWS